MNQSWECHAGSFCAGLDQPARERLRELGITREFDSSEILYVQGQPARHVVVVMVGHVKVTRHSTTGRETLLAVRTNGHVLGADEVLQGGGILARRTTVEALNDVAGLVIEAHRFVRFLDTEKGAWRAIAQELRNRVVEAELRTAGRSADSAGRRLAKVLLALIPPARSFVRVRVEEGARTRSDFGLTQAELASLIGSSRETVERTLKQWRVRGLVSTSYRNITILQPEALARIAGVKWASTTVPVRTR
ncbi:MAG: transcriptional regulator [Massilia sp.]|jgi:CRP-like cAMP-binding protein|nr:transcriptional regulator [Massilia sp.]